MSTVFDNSKAEKALETIADQGTGLSSRVCRVILAHARESWEGNVRSALEDIREGVCSRSALANEGVRMAQVCAFADALPTSFGFRKMTAEELSAAEKARLDRISAHAAECAARGLGVGQVASPTCTGAEGSSGWGDGDDVSYAHGD